MERLNFNPVNLYEDSTAFPDPSSEIETRRQLNEGCKQIQTHINNVVSPKIESIENRLGDQVTFTLSGTILNITTK